MDTRNPIRIITATSLFDGHDASINMIRRLLQDAGAEVIHLGHNRSVLEVVTAALQEGVQGICVSSYQGGHIEFFKYMKDLLRQFGADYIKVFGGGGGVIVHREKRELEEYGIDFIFHSDDGRRMGLDGMIRLIMEKCDFSIQEASQKMVLKKDSRQDFFENHSHLPHRFLGLALDAIDRDSQSEERIRNKTAMNPLILEGLASFRKDFRGESGENTFSEKRTDSVSSSSSSSSSSSKEPLVLGVTGTGGAGKSSLVDELIQRFLNSYPDIKLAVLCVDPSKKKTGGALLGDRIRMNSLSRPGVFMRSVASRGGLEIADSLPRMLEFLKSCRFDLIIAETSGIGQANGAIVPLSDLCLYVMTSEFGAQSQLEKIDMIDFAHFIAINKADHRGSLDALRDVRKQYKRSHKVFEVSDEKLPVFLTQASQFNDLGVNRLFFSIVDDLAQRDSHLPWSMTQEQRKNIRGAEKTRSDSPGSTKLFNSNCIHHPGIQKTNFGSGTESFKTWRFLSVKRGTWRPTTTGGKIKKRFIHRGFTKTPILG